VTALGRRTQIPEY